MIDKLWYSIIFDWWGRQDNYVEVWVEKDALSGVISQPCNEYRVPYMACKGYMSSSAAWEAGQRFKTQQENGKNCVLIHLGDHDPSGIDMTRDNGDRLFLFSENNVEVRRIALNMSQIRQYNPPPNPAKLSDSRSNEYVRQYGDSSWELDALEPRIMAKLIEDEIKSLIDFEIWESTKAEEVKNEDILKNLSNNWPDVQDFLATLEN
ncbi:MAG: hypothetical protein COB24_09020 [Hyphomicrobiales bacterium]|nr:MAG: hypothetical protein COB24_09020 [Hyphomicrobiales bacterium]